jgi:prepilin-type N-terminal cleavage/methylation domain-containing protein
MRHRSPGQQRLAEFRGGFSLIELIISTLIMGVVLVTALKCVGSVVQSRTFVGDQVIGAALAQDLMAEILSQPYLDPDDPPVFGREGSESGGDRIDFDDVDDYDAWDRTAPEQKDGTKLAGRNDWRRAVAVDYVSPTNLTTTVGTDQDVKRVTITVSKDGRVMATLVGIRANVSLGMGDE